MGERVVILGDAMIDEYVHVAVERISPEAPVPVMRELGRERRPGGAANVRMNFLALGVEAELIETDGRPRPKKTRFITKRGQQVARLDLEDCRPISKGLEGKLEMEISEMVADAFVISDYCKGVVTPTLAQCVIRRARELKVPCIVDSKHPDWHQFRGATVITPNHTEMTNAVNVDSNITYILETCGEYGANLHFESGEIKPIEAYRTQKVADVTGAGDTVLAAVTMKLLGTNASSYYMVEAAKYAMKAAAIAVSKQGTATVTREEIDNA